MRYSEGWILAAELMDERTKKAFDILWKARENLLKFLVDEVIEKEPVLTGKTNYEGALGFEYQELDNKYMARLASLNTFLHNLTAGPGGQARKQGTLVNRVEAFVASPETLEREINGVLRKYSTLKLVSTSLQEAEEGKVLVVLSLSSP